MRKGNAEMVRVIEMKNDVVLKTFMTPKATHNNNAQISIPDRLRKWCEYVGDKK
jgi:hypothetical protein